MYANLCPGAVGLGGPMEELLPLAKRAGFAGVDPNVADSPESLTRLYEDHGLLLGSVGLPVQFRDTPAKFRSDLTGLYGFAARLRELGCTRCATWLAPASDDLTYQENFRRHVRRLRPVAEILADQGVRLGLEFVGPATCRSGKRCEFVHTLAQLQELRAAIDVNTVGILLDAWHWYTSGSSLDDLRQLSNDDIVLIHVSDAPAGVPVDEQIDSKRELPGQTGVIDLHGFMGVLREIGYDGPVSVEPFCERLKELPREERAKAVADSLLSIMP